MNSISWTCPFALTATSLVVVSSASLARKPMNEACPIPKHPPTTNNFFNGKVVIVIASLPLVKLASGSCCPQSEFQASAYHCNQFLLKSYSTGSLDRRLSLCLGYSLPPFTDSSLSHQPGLFPGQPTFCYMSLGCSQTLYIRASTTWLRWGKHRRIHRQCYKFLLILCVFLPRYPPTPHAPWNCKLSSGQELSVSFATASSAQCLM